MTDEEQREAPKRDVTQQLIALRQNELYLRAQLREAIERAEAAERYAQQQEASAEAARNRAERDWWGRRAAEEALLADTEADEALTARVLQAEAQLAEHHRDRTGTWKVCPVCAADLTPAEAQEHQGA